MALRFLQQNLIMNAQSPVCQAWSYPSTHPMEFVFDKDYFLSANDRLRPGDTIRIVQMRDANIHARDNVVIAFCDSIVVQSGKDGVVIHAGSIITAAPAQAVPAPTAEKRVQWNPGRKKHEVICGSEVVFSTDDKAQAEAWLPKPM